MTAALVDLAAAEDTADIRTVGADAADAAEQTEEYLDEIPAGERPTDLIAVSRALSAIASLEDVSGEAPAAWDQAEPVLESVAAADVPQINDALVADAVDNADDVVDASVQTYETWLSANAAAVAARDEAITEATTYRAQMQSQIDEYIELRNELSDYIEVVDTQGSTMDAAYYKFQTGADGRREVRDAMQALDAPADVRSDHSRVVTVISDGIDAMAAALRDLDMAECDWEYCYIYDEPAYQTFRSESRRITQSLDDAIAEWTRSADQAVADAEAIPLPPKPAL